MSLPYSQLTDNLQTEEYKSNLALVTLFVVPSKLSMCSVNYKQSMLRRMKCNSVIMREVIYLFIAVQMWCLSSHLPLIIGDLIPPENAKWQLYLILLEITSICFSPTLSKDQIYGVREGTKFVLIILGPINTSSSWSLRQRVAVFNRTHVH